MNSHDSPKQPMPGIEERFALLAMAEQREAEQRNRRLRRWMIYVPLSLAIIGFLWAAIHFLRMIAP